MKTTQLHPLGTVTAPPNSFFKDALGSVLGAELGGDLIALADAVAAVGPQDDQRETVAYLALAALTAVSRGSTRLPTTAKELEPLIASQTPTAIAQRIETLLATGHPLVGQAHGTHEPYTPFIHVGNWLYLHFTYRFEKNLIAKFQTRLRRIAAGADTAQLQVALASVLSNSPRRDQAGKPTPMELSRDQVYAALLAALAPLAIISGGPGTGKTTIVATVLRLLQRMGVPMSEVALAAPTGKAAYRMGESLRQQMLSLAPDPQDEAIRTNPPSQQTLHRLLGYSQRTGRFTYHENNLLPYQVVIVDEASMVGVRLMEQLLRALREDARLILLGDKDQLPSVDAGAVLRDLMPKQRATIPALRDLIEQAPLSDQTSLPEPAEDSPHALCAVVLEKSHRVDASKPGGKALFEAAQQVRAGRSPEIPQVPTARPLLLPQEGVHAIWLATENQEASQAVQDFAVAWYEQRLKSFIEDGRHVSDYLSTPLLLTEGGFASTDCARLERLFQHFEASRLLCISRHFASGSDAMNQHIARLASGNPTRFFPGLPVLMTKNDYTRNLFNGDQGLIVSVRIQSTRSEQIMAVFRRSVVEPGGTYKSTFEAFSLGTIQSSLESAYAMTVHKSQGSEYEHIGILLPPQDIPALLTREILYTALTRARTSAVLVGEKALLTTAVARELERHTGIAEGLRVAV